MGMGSPSGPRQCVRTHSPARLPSTPERVDNRCTHPHPYRIICVRPRRAARFGQDARRIGGPPGRAPAGGGGALR
ncbi:hypothetical protein GCM10027451_24470 [Geodermatophilus aquaeductus]